MAWRLGLISLVVTAVVLLLVFFDVGLALREALIWLMTFKATLKVYALRRLISPFFRVLSKVLLLILGKSLYRRFKKYMTDIGAWVRWRWAVIPRWMQWTVGSVGLFVGGLLGFGVYLLPIWIPFLKPLATKFHFWWFDRLAESRLKPIRARYRRWLRTNVVLVWGRKPHRIMLYWTVLGIRRVARAVRHRWGAQPV